MKNFNGYGLFYDVRNYTTRVYNRVNVYMNVRDRHGIEVARNYLRKFNRREQVELFKMMTHIKVVGYEQFRRDVFRARNK